MRAAWCLVATLLAPVALAQEQETTPQPAAPESAPAAAPELEQSVPSATVDPKAVARVRFEARALRLRIHGDDVQVRRGNHPLSDTELRSVTLQSPVSQKWRAVDLAERRHSIINSVGIGSCIGLPALGAVAGGVGGALAYVAYGIYQSQAFLPSSLAAGFFGGACAGGCVGGLLGVLALPVTIATNEIVDAVDDSELTPEDYARLITDHNRMLAKSVGADVSTLDPEYFPAGF